MKDKNSLKIVFIVGAVCILLFIIGYAYSFFEYRGVGNNIQLSAGDMGISFVNGNNYLNIDSAYPVSDGMGRIYPYYADFSLNATVDNMDIDYEIQLAPDESSTIDSKYIKVYLTDQDDNIVVVPTIYGDLRDATFNKAARTIFSGKFAQSGSRNFRLRVWIDESYNKNTSENFGFKIYLYATN